MRVLILTDASFATRERSMLSRLEVGLADEGVRIIHATPRSTSPETGTPPAGELFVQPMIYEDRGPALLRRVRVRRLVEAVESMREPHDDRAVDIVHAFGDGAWATAADVAARFEAALALEVWSAASIEEAAAFRAAADIPLVFFAPDRPTEQRLRSTVATGQGAAIRLTPWGVHTPAAPHALFDPGRLPSAVIVGSGADRPAFTAALQGLASPGPQTSLIAFMDAAAGARAGAWPLINRLGLTDRLTLTPDAEARRDLTLKCDVLIVPDASGDHRSIVLDAMACGLVVVAAADPMVGWLADGATARLVREPRPDAWAAALAAVLTDLDGSRRLAASARDHVRQNQRASAHVASVVDAYEWLTAGDALPFGAPGA